MGTRQAQRAVRAWLRAIGEDPDRPGLAQTPALVAAAIPELFDGIGRDPAEALRPIDGGADVEVGIGPIAFTSWCEHHLLPFVGHAEVRYLPRDRRVAGLGDVARAVALAARRLTLQERMTEQLADAIDRALAPAWLEVAVEATHLCLVARGARATGAEVRTVARRPAPPGV